MRSAPSSACSSLRSSALWAVCLGGLFFLVYGGTNWITSWRTDVGTLYFQWERQIPFIPILIIPYMSIDLFFLGSFFLCTSRRELRTLASRVILAMLLSAMGFLLFPLQFAFERPPVDGVLGAIFAVLSAFDRPYNLIPSLHISLLAIIRVVYRQRTRGWARTALEAWLILIAVSTVVTYQHHVLDVVSGGVVGLLAFLLFPSPGIVAHPGRRDVAGPRRRKFMVGSRYALGGVVLLLMAYLSRPWAAILAWPAVSLSLVAGAYFGAGPGVFRKSGGRLPTGTRILLAPYLWGVHLSHLYYHRRHPAYAEVVPGILIGRMLTDPEARELIGLGVRAVLDLTVESSESGPFLHLPYQNVQILDLAVPTLLQLNRAAGFIRAQRRRGPVYIHCALGYSRSACAVAAYLLQEGLAETVADAIQIVRNARREIVMPDDLTAMLHAFHARMQDRNTTGRIPSPDGPTSRSQSGLPTLSLQPSHDPAYEAANHLDSEDKHAARQPVRRILRPSDQPRVGRGSRDTALVLRPDV